MKTIEPATQDAAPGLTSRIADFWARNVNAERIMGRAVSRSARGTETYFRELEDQRYRSHLHLPGWIASMHAGAAVLDVGCGVGLDSAAMARRGLQVTGVDLTNVAVATAQRRARERQLRVDYACADAEHLPFAGNTFDYVYSFGVMHHAADTQRCVDEAYRVLKDGGEALVMLYHRRSLNELVHRLLRVPFEERDELCPVVRRFSRAEVRAMFARFRSVEVHADFVYGEGYGALFRCTPRPLYRLMSRWAGWHLMIRARR